MDNQKWQLEGLIKRAFERTKERFLSYFLTWVASFAFVLGLMVLLLLAIGLVAVIYGITKSALLVVLFSIILMIAFYVALIFVTSWIGLATISVLIDDKKLGVGETFSKVKPLVWGYFWMNLVVSFFLLGLMPFAFLSFFIVLVLWLFWSSFLSFAYLKFQKRGLQSLWISRQMFLTRGWGIFGRMVLVNLAVLALSFLISFSLRNAAGRGLSFLFSVVTGPFLISFEYEMFRNLEKPKEVKKPTVWFVLSLVGWVLMIFGIIVTGALIVQNITGLVNQYQNNPQEFLKYIIPTPTGSPF